MLSGHDLLGRSVGRCSYKYAAGRQSVVADGSPSQTEIHHHRLALFIEHDVGRLEVSMNDPSGMSHGQRPSHGHNQTNRISLREPTLSLDPAG